MLHRLGVYDRANRLAPCASVAGDRAGRQTRANTALVVGRINGDHIGHLTASGCAVLPPPAAACRVIYALSDRVDIHFEAIAHPATTRRSWAQLGTRRPMRDDIVIIPSWKPSSLQGHGAFL